ncbi:DUF84 family protein [Bacillus sp. FJAT-45037]|uniref:DUF84 family protein n=1 Tax=Bacillus sp. FJAT-45037 TaxID=2011007 RepID=UPI000C24BE72|nr:DUF84 family protein [Bacillus sp. FJAT-45037]
MIIGIGTKNPAKVHAVIDTLIREPYEFISVDAPSGVASQPFSEEETMEGAMNRAKHTLSVTNANIAFGLEGGVVQTSAGLMLCNWGALVSDTDQIFVASGAKIPLPVDVEKDLKLGHELGDVMARLTENRDIRKKEGAIGIFTAERLTRKAMFSHIVQILYGQYEYACQHFKH